ncbi:error-prone DNA polymerase [Sediminivirga luteola]|uniref:Error-prone DNA polymerase n=1 Tax=Sediminivirga luteola TaxID=1774748 RepID=A0A8J2XEL1_9MICO|nr:error-prone DNA polymerase [Sediminivirga luteola]GGA08848.1 error-prone DNA polymerase [Sediminivirga luteola]
MSGWFNPRITWAELEGRLSADSAEALPPEARTGEPLAHRRRPSREGRKARQDRKPQPEGTTPGTGMVSGEASPRRKAPAGKAQGTRSARYAELHAHSNFSFLHGASSPEQLVKEAIDRGLSALALTDHDGFYGAARFARAAEGTGLATVFGASLPLPEGRLPLLCAGVEGYRRLSSAITRAQMAGSKDGIRCEAEDLAAQSGGHWQVLTGGRDGPLHAHLGDDDGGLGYLRQLRDLFGPGHVEVELVRHGLPDDDERIRHLSTLAERAGLPVVAANAVRYAVPAQMRLAQAVEAVSRRSSMEQIAGELPAATQAMLRGPEEMTVLFAEHPGAVARAVQLGDELSFQLSLAEPRLPEPPVEGQDHAKVLREYAIAGTLERYGPRATERVKGAWAQVERELDAVESMGFCGYFLIVHDIARFCREANIFCQGRGSAAGSALCYVLGITAVDSVAEGLLFERFLAPERDGYPDIDLDIESARREEVIQYVYRHYGRDRAAQVANVISYRGRSAVRDMARALGYAPGQQDAWAKQVERWGELPETAGEGEDGIPGQVLELASQMLKAPRHLGIHSGGMVLCDRPVSEVVPVEWGRMENRSVVQWDKDDCADMKLVKFDLLGLGMLGALHEMVDLVRQRHGLAVERSLLNRSDPRVYEMLCRGDAVGVFQVESRAQLATLPRLAPTNIYELAIQVAIIRPGPIQGGSVHPYIRRKQEKEEVTYPHEMFKPVLKRTLGVPLFQEQLMQLAMVAADFTGGDADELRRAMSAKRSLERMQGLKERFFAGTDKKGIDRSTAEAIYAKIEAFANYGFPESHAISFAALVFDSAWFKCYFPAAFCVGLLRHQPMGFYSPQSLIADARRHGVEIRGVDINASEVQACLEGDPPQLSGFPREPVEADAIRLGLGSIRGLGTQAAELVVAARDREGAFSSVADLCHRVELSQGALEALAAAGAFDSLGISRREALWTAGALAGAGPQTLPGVDPGSAAPRLPEAGDFEQTLGELWATGTTAEDYPTVHLRDELTSRGISGIDALKDHPGGTRVSVAGLVTHRQRPATATGITFMNLEDEYGMLNVVCTAGLWKRYRQTALRANAIIVHGVLQREGPVISVRAERLEALPTSLSTRSRDFQ